MALSDIAETKIAWLKAEILILLKGFSRDEVRKNINEVISKEMKITLEEAKKMKTIRPSVVKKILLTFE